MQESAVNEHDAERVGPSWYLSRDGEQIGPLTDRELSLFAEGGNFRPEDLLWTAGLDAWKPAGAVFGLKQKSNGESGSDPAPAADAREDEGGETADESPVFLAPTADADMPEPVEANGQPADAMFDFVSSEAETPEGIEPDVIEPEGIDPEIIEPERGDLHALVQALKGETARPKPALKERAVAELKKFAGAFVYLWVVFTVLLLHEWIVLSEHHVGFAFYGLATLNAIALGKIMIVAEQFRFAERLKEKPLVYPIVYKTVAFTTLLLVAYVLEMMLFGLIGGHGFLASAPALGGSLLGTAALWLIFCVALMPYFAFKEFERAVGPDMLRKLLLGRR
ncbi:MAG: DUF4339 domain-containing protein [Methyloceanibacter sp.]|uniref:DUF4339 domain-containing protein n=1 Tax=Methyloceanibacter sp. TaxID=1965321 RepID=UPI003EDE8DDF